MKRKGLWLLVGCWVLWALLWAGHRALSPIIFTDNQAASKPELGGYGEDYGSDSMNDDANSSPMPVASDSNGVMVPDLEGPGRHGFLRLGMWSGVGDPAVLTTDATLVNSQGEVLFYKQTEAWTSDPVFGSTLALCLVDIDQDGDKELFCAYRSQDVNQDFDQAETIRSITVLDLEGNSTTDMDLAGLPWSRRAYARYIQKLLLMEVETFGQHPVVLTFLGAGCVLSVLTVRCFIIRSGRLKGTEEPQ